MLLRDLGVEAVDNIVVRDAKGDASDAESKALRQPENMFIWIRSLIRQRSLAEAHIATRRNKMRKLARQMGVGESFGPPPREYLTEKDKLDSANSATRRFIAGINERIYEAKDIIDRHDSIGVSRAYLVECIFDLQAIADSGLECEDVLDDMCGVLHSVVGRLPDPSSVE